MSLKERLSDLEAKQKKRIVWAIILLLLLAVTSVGYNLRSDRAQRVKKSRNTTRQIELEPDLIQKTMLQEQRQEIQILNQALTEMRDELEALRRNGLQGQQNSFLPSGSSEKVEKWPLPLDSQGKPITPEELAEADSVPVFFAPQPDKDRRQSAAPKTPAPPGQNRQPEMIGGIGILSNPNQPPVASENKGRSVYLPPGFMEGVLLTGFDASTAGKGTGDPEPLLIRIQTPAVLPNDIKADLQGCFVIAEVRGRLDKERGDTRLTNLSCLSKDGSAIIDESIKGFVTDSDSKVGLSGHVVSKMGSAAARAVIAGAFGGAGEWLKAASSTQSISPLGSITTADLSELGTSTAGAGLAKGAETLEDIYIDLVKQTSPVVEVTAGKKITVVIAEGKEITIKERKNESL
jgi:conjugal transfer pilus assembly protein TraB